MPNTYGPLSQRLRIHVCNHSPIFGSFQDLVSEPEDLLQLIEIFIVQVEAVRVTTDIDELPELVLGPDSLVRIIVVSGI